MKYLAMLAVLALPVGISAHAESLVIDGIDSAQAPLQQRPKRGMSMESVESRYGQPVTKRAAIGDPPISRWEYSGFVVYFEYRHVIHAVAKR